MTGRATTTVLALVVPAVLAAVTPAAAQRRNAIHLTPEGEQDVIRMLTTGSPEDWHQARSLAGRVPLDERSPALREAMRDGLMRAFYGLGIRGEGISIMTLHVAANADPADIPVLARITVGGPAAKTLYNWGHQATPHLVEAAMSPETPSMAAQSALSVLAGIVTTHGTGGYDDMLAEAAALHLDGPPTHYRSLGFPSTMKDAIALVAALRTPELLKRLEDIAVSTPEQLAERTGQDEVSVRQAPRCAKRILDGVVPEDLPRPERRLCRDPAAWTDPDMFLDMVTNSPDGRGGDYWRGPVRRKPVPPWLRGV